MKEKFSNISFLVLKDIDLKKYGKTLLFLEIVTISALVYIVAASRNISEELFPIIFIAISVLGLLIIPAILILTYKEKLFIKNLYQGRLNRTNFLIGNLILIIFLLIMIIIIFSTSSGIISAVLLIPIFIMYSSLMMRRLNDVGPFFDKRMSFKIIFSFFAVGWILYLAGFQIIYQSLLFVFYIVLNLILLFKKGDPNQNLHGATPPKIIKFPKDLLGIT